MKPGIDPILPLWLLGAAALLYLLLLYAFYRPYLRVLARSYWWTLISVKCLSLLFFLLALMNPYLLQRRPDSQKYRIAVLADASGSMKTADCEGRSRIEVLRRILNPEEAFFNRVLAHYENADFFLFSGDEFYRSEPGGVFSTLPGDTDIDGAMEKVLQLPGDERSLAALLLLSDGLDNAGASVMEGARSYKKAGVPVHTILIGDSRSKRDLSIAFKSVPKSAMKGRDFSLELLAERNFKGEQEARLELYEGERLIESRDLRFTGEQQQAVLNIDHVVFREGFKTYKARIVPLPGEENLLNNLAFAGLKVRPPDRFKVLYLSANLDWEYKYLRLMAGEHDRLQLDALIRLSEKSWFIRGFSEEKEDGGESIPDAARPPGRFPEAAELNDYQCLIVNLGHLYLLREEELIRLAEFVEKRGGGIVFSGAAETVPETVQRMLPVKSLPSELVELNRSRLEFKPSRVLAPRKLDSLKDLAQRVYLPDESAIYRIRSEEIKPGALTVATVKGPAWVTLAVQNYGLGKVALLNFTDTWKWVMESESGSAAHAVFWSRLITWLSSSSRERFLVQPRPGALRLAGEERITVDLLDSSFIAANDAELECIVTLPSGTEERLELYRDEKVDGRYAGQFLAREAGVYRFSFRAAFQDQEELRRVAEYIAVDDSPEAEPLPAAAGLMQSLSRLTGGQYWDWRQLSSINDLPSSQRIHYLEEKRYLLGSWLFLLAVLFFALPDWFLRHRIGLR